MVDLNDHKCMFEYTDEELLEMISGELHRMDQTCSVSITFDRDFTEE